MTILQSVFLGLLQGFAEFLPISSSGHLLLAERLFDVQSNLFFDVMLHLGTLLAVVVAMRHTLWNAIAHPVTDKKLRYVVVASIPTFAIALLVKLFVPEDFLAKLLPIGFALTIVLIVVTHCCAKPTLRLQQTGWLAVIVTGFAQGIAVLPGLSRSGSTICAMKLFGTNGTDSAEFSFLLSIPIILAAAVVETWQTLQTQPSIDWLCVVVGIVCAFVAGYVALKTVMRAVKTRSWIGFAVYLAIPLLLSLITL